MPTGQEEETPSAHRLDGGGKEPFGLDMVCSLLSLNNQDEYCNSLTEYSMDQAALLFSCYKFLHLIVREGRAEKKALIQAKCTADVLNKAYETAMHCSPDDFRAREMVQRAAAIVENIEEKVNAQMENLEAASAQDTVEALTIQLIKQQEDYAARMMKLGAKAAKAAEAAGGQDEDAEDKDTDILLDAQLQKQAKDCSDRLKMHAARGQDDNAEDQLQKQEEDYAARLKKLEEDCAGRLKKQEEDYAARLQKLEEDSAARLKKQEEDASDLLKKHQEGYDAQLKKKEEDYAALLKKHAADGKSDDAEEQDTVSALKTQLMKQEEDYAARLKKQKEEYFAQLKKQKEDSAVWLRKQKEDADAKLKDRMTVEEDLHKKIRALQEGSSSPDTNSSGEARYEVSAREEKLMEENAVMQNRIAALQVKLKEAHNGVLPPHGTAGTTELEDNPGTSTPATADK